MFRVKFSILLFCPCFFQSLHCCRIQRHFWFEGSFKVDNLWLLLNPNKVFLDWELIKDNFIRLSYFLFDMWLMINFIIIRQWNHICLLYSTTLVIDMCNIRFICRWSNLNNLFTNLSILELSFLLNSLFYPIESVFRFKFLWRVNFKHACRLKNGLRSQEILDSFGWVLIQNELSWFY